MELTTFFVKINQISAWCMVMRVTTSYRSLKEGLSPYSLTPLLLYRDTTLGFSVGHRTTHLAYVSPQSIPVLSLSIIIYYTESSPIQP